MSFEGATAFPGGAHTSSVVPWKDPINRIPIDPKKTAHFLTCLLFTATAVSATVNVQSGTRLFLCNRAFPHCNIRWHQGNRATQYSNKNTRLVVWHVSLIWRTRAWCWKGSRKHTHMYSYIRALIACSASVCGMLWDTSCDNFGSNHPAYIQTNVCQRTQLQLIDAETARVLC